MTKTLQAALAPLIIFGSFFSLSLFEYPLGHSRPYLSCLYSLATWSFPIYFIHYSLYHIFYSKSNIITYWRIHILTTTILLIPVSFFYFKVKVLYLLIVSNITFFLLNFLLKFLNLFLTIFLIESIKGVFISQL